LALLIVKFGEVMFTSEDITDEFEIDTFPTLIIYWQTESGIESELFVGGELKFNTIGDWLDGFALEQKAEPYEDKKLQG